MQDKKKKKSSARDQQATPGSILQGVRRDMGLSVAEVAEATRISKKNIRAIEAAAFEELPADTFVRGLVTIYGNYLGLDGGKLAADFLLARKKLSSGGRPQNLTLKTVPPSSFSAKKLAEPAQISSATLALILFLLILVSFSGFCFYTSWNPLACLTRQTDSMQTSIQKIFADMVGESETAAQKEPAGQGQEGSETQIAATGTVESADMEPNDYRLDIHFLKNCAVTIVTDDKAPLHREGKNGQVVVLRAKKQIKVIFSLPGAATLTLNGVPLSFPEASQGALPTLLLPDDLLDQ